MQWGNFSNSNALGIGYNFVCSAFFLGKQFSFVIFQFASFNIFISNICDRNKRNVQQFIHSKHIRLLIVLGTCLHGGGGLQVGEVTRLSIQSVILVDHVYITVGGVTRQGELTPLSRVKFSHVNVSRWGNPPSRGRIRDTEFAQNSLWR